MNEYTETMSIYRCPICEKRLIKSEKGLTCPNKHHYDLSREGYVNLLLNKGGGTHGDNREMVVSRERFLERGHYLPLRMMLTMRMRAQVPEAILDAGCGEGWYTEGIASAFPASKLAALDVSKDAAALCAKRLKGRAQCAVGSVYDLPLENESVDAVISAFSPFAREEFLRVLRPGGMLYMAVPGEKHLWQLKELLYDKPYENELRSKHIPGFEFVMEDELHYTRFLEGEELRDLFAMTPYFYRTPKEGRERALACMQTDMEMAFYLFVYKKKDEVKNPKER